MAWHTRASYAPTDPPVVLADALQAIADDLRAFGGNVDAAGYALTNLLYARLNAGTLPSSPTVGMMAVDSADNYLKQWTGSAWVALASGSVFCECNQPTTAINVSNGGVVAIPWENEVEDAAGVHSPGSPTRLTVPTGQAGRYLINCSVRWQTATASGANYTALSIYKNGSQLRACALPAAGANVVQELTAIASLVPGDYVEIVVNQATGGTLQVVASASQTYVQLCRLA